MPAAFFHALVNELPLSLRILTPPEVIFLALLLLATAILPSLALVYRLQSASAR